jgi:hypothetical protein
VRFSIALIFMIFTLVSTGVKIKKFKMILPCAGCMYNGIPMVMREKFSASSYWKDCVKYKVTAAQYIGEVCR